MAKVTPKTKSRFDVSTSVTQAKIIVKLTDTEKLGLEVTLDLTTGVISLDLSSYRNIKINQLKTIGEVMIMVAKEAQDAMKLL